MKKGLHPDIHFRTKPLGLCSALTAQNVVVENPSMEDWSLIVGGSLIALLGLGCALGGWVLWNRAPDSWEDVTATRAVVRRTAKVLVAVSLVLICSGIACMLRIQWACEAGALATLAFVAGGFLGNYVVYGDLRLKHTVTSVVIAIAILWLLWQGYPK